MPIDFSQLPDQQPTGRNIQLGDLPDQVPPVRMVNALRTNPDQFATAKTLADQSGLPTPVVERNLDEVSRKARAREVQTLIDESPELTRAFSKEAFAKLAHDDVRVLAKTARIAKAAGGAVAQATLGISESVLRTPNTVNRWLDYWNEIGKDMGLPEWMTTPLVANPLDVLERGVTVGNQHFGGTTDAANALSRAQGLLAQDTETFGETFARLGEKAQQADQAFSAAVDGDVEPLLEVLADPEAWAGFIGQAAPSLYTAYKSGGSIPFLAWLEGMEVANDAAEFEQRTGQKIDPRLFAQAQAQTATINAILERFGLEQVFGNAGKRTVSGFLRGALTEGGTEGLQQFNTNVAKLLSFDPSQKLSEGVLPSILGGFGTGGPAGAVSALGKASGPNSEFARNLDRSMQTVQHQQNLDQLVETAVESKLRERAPEEYRDFLDNVLGAEEAVYIDTASAQQFFQANPEALQVVEDRMPEVAAEFKESLLRGGDIAIPKADYLTWLTDYHETLREVVRNDVDGMNAVEAAEWRENQEQSLKEEAERILTERDADTTWKASVGVVQDTIKNELQQTGRFTDEVNDAYATLVSTFYGRQADRLGVTPEELYQRYPLRVRGGLQQGIERFDQKPVDSDTETNNNDAYEVKEVDYEEFALRYRELQAEQNPYRTVAGGTPDQSWSEATSLRREGRPILVYRGGRQNLSAESFQELGQSTGHPSAALGVWFSSDQGDAARYGAVIDQAHLDIRNPRIYTTDEVPAFESPAEAEQHRKDLQAEGHDGIVLDYRDVGGPVHYVAFEADQVIVPLPAEFFQGAREQETKLSALHSLSSENLEFADKMGGLAVPSIAVVKDDMAMEGYGDITLIGTKDLGDPKRVPIYDSDAYSSTFPKPEYKAVKVKDADKVIKRLRPFVEKFEDNSHHEIFDYMVNRPDAGRAMELLQRSQAAQALFLSDQGVDVKPVMRPVQSRMGAWSFDPVFIEQYKAFRTKYFNEPSYVVMESDEYRALSDAARAAIDRSLKAEMKNVEKEHRAEICQELRDIYTEQAFDEDGLLHWAVYDMKLAQDAKNAGQMTVDLTETREVLEKALDGREREYRRWLEEWIIPLYGEPRLKISGKWQPYTLENIVRKMTGGGVKAAEKTMVFGGGNARAVAAKQFRSLEAMRKMASEQMGTPDDIKAAREEAEELLDRYRTAVVNYFNGRDWRGNVDIWDGLDASMRAIAKVAKAKNRTPATVRNALRSEDFNVDSISDETLEMGVKAAEAMLYAPVPYFEAKPKRIVALEEFAGAVVADDVEPEITALLDKHGIPWKKYGKAHDEEARTKAVIEFRRELAEQGMATLFQKNRGSIQFPDGMQGQTFINLLEDADLSTFLHEAGHFFLEVMNDIALQSEAPAAIRADMERVLRWFGVSADEWAAMSIEEKRKHHERFAEAFEVYLFEGKSPNLEIQGLFQRFRAWLTQVYRNFRNYLSPDKISPEIREVFNRMLASEADIQAAETAHQYRPLFESAEEAGMSPDEWLKYQALGEESTEKATQELQTRSLRDMKWLANAKAKALKKLQRDAKTKRKEMRYQVEQEVFRRPVYAAKRFFERGILRARGEEPVSITEGYKLSIPALREMYGEKVRRSDPNTVDPTLDDLLTAIAKLGGLDRIEAEAQGIDPAHWSRQGDNQPLFGKPIFRKEGGRSFDDMAEALGQYDYLTDVSPNGLLDKLDRALAGDAQYSTQIDYNDLYGDPLLAMEGAPDWRSLGYGKYGALASTGLHPDEAAPLFGFASGDAMVRALVDAPPMNEVIERETDQRMLEAYGDITDAKAQERAAEAAIHNNARGRFINAELRALSKATGKRPVLAKAARNYAEQAIARKQIKDIKPHQYTVSEAKAARASKQALRQGDTAQAAEHKRAQLLNHYFFRAANNGREEVDKALRYLKKFTKPIKSIDQDYQEQIQALLAPFDLRQGVSFKELEERAGLREWIEKQVEQGFEPAIDESLVEAARHKHYKEMTLEELRGMVDTIRQIEHLGRLKRKLLTAKDKREFAERMDEARQSIEANANRTVEERATPTDVVGMTVRWWRGFLAMHRKFASIIREMDGSQDGGVMWNLLARTMNEAGDRETELRAQASEKMAELFKPILSREVPGNLYTRKRVVPGTNLSMTREQRIMFAMNWGNEGNRQRLRDGGLSGHQELTEREVFAILDTLTKEEWDFVQSIWDYFETFRPEIAKQEKLLTGKEPEWIEPAPVKTQYGTYRGGYFPAKYDAELSTRSESLEAVTNLRMSMKGAFNAAATRNSYTKERAKQVHNRPILLSFNTISQHVNEVAHRLAWQAWLVDANRTLKALDGTIREHYGPEILRELRDTVKDVAQGDAPATNDLERFINRIRVGSTIVGLGWRFTTALIQPTGLAQSWVRVGGPWIARGMRQFMLSPVAASKDVMARSKLMRDRARTLQREVNEVLNVVRAGEKVSTFKASYFYLIQKLQWTVDLPTWLGAYEKAVAQLGLENAPDAAARAAFEEQAVSMADQAVIDSQSGGQLKDLAKVQRGSPIFKLFTNFYSYFSATYNLNVEAVRRTNFRSPAAVGLLMADLTILNVVPVLMTVALKELLKGECEWDMECLAKRLGYEQLSYLFGQMILLRESGTALEAATGGNNYGYSGPSGLRFFADLYKFGQQVGQGDADMALFKKANEVAGALLHYPAGQVNQTLEGILAIENGEVKGTGILPALLAGPPRH